MYEILTANIYLFIYLRFTIKCKQKYGGQSRHLGVNITVWTENTQDSLYKYISTQNKYISTQNTTTRELNASD